VTSAIQYVTSENMPVVYQIQGHKETAVSGDFADVITKSNVTLQELTLLKCDKIPDDAAAIIINGPTSDFSSDDVAKVNTYLQGGGKAFIATTYSKEKLPNFYSILSGYGVTVADGVVMEGDTNHYYQQPYYLLPEIASNELTSSASASNGYVFAPSSQGMTYPKNTASTESTGSTESTSDGITYTPLLTTTDQAYSKVNVNSNNTGKESSDISGPFALGLDVKKTAANKKTTDLIVYSCAGMFTDDANKMVSGNNSALFSDAMKGLVDTSGNSTTVIPVKKYDAATLIVPTNVIIIGAALGIAVIPLALIISGILIWVKRRKR
jgi:ABC-2 type transport system permease protein